MVETSNPRRQEQTRWRLRKNRGVVDNAARRAIGNNEARLEMSLVVDRGADRRPLRCRERCRNGDLPDPSWGARSGQHLGAVFRENKLQFQQTLPVVRPL